MFKTKGMTDMQKDELTTAKVIDEFLSTDDPLLTAIKGKKIK